MKYILVLLTWLAPTLPSEDGSEPTPIVIPLYRQEIPRRTLELCNDTIKRLRRGWITLPDDSFGYSMNCQLNPEYKPKGQRK